MIQITFWLDWKWWCRPQIIDQQEKCKHENARIWLYSQMDSKWSWAHEQSWDVWLHMFDVLHMCFINWSVEETKCAKTALLTKPAFFLYAIKARLTIILALCMHAFCLECMQSHCNIYGWEINNFRISTFGICSQIELVRTDKNVCKHMWSSPRAQLINQMLEELH